MELNKKQLYFAPLEGIGGYIYRNAQADFFPRADKYFSPFLAPNQNRCFSPKEKRDILPENNKTIHLVPQILTNNAEIFCRTADALGELGYEEVNLNLGCPSKTVVTKFRGAGFLADPDRLDAFLEEIFDHTELKISLKTRLGIESGQEFPGLLKIYRKYPLAELIVHPRVQQDYYKNKPQQDAFALALAQMDCPVIYNGDLFCAGDYEAFVKENPEVPGVMFGRGVLADPALFGEVRHQMHLEKETLKAFHQRLLEDYTEEMSGERNVLFKMKELWYYLAHSFTNSEKYAKKIRKVQRLADYKEIVRSLCAEQEICENTFNG